MAVSSAFERVGMSAFNGSKQWFWIQAAIFQRLGGPSPQNGSQESFGAKSENGSRNLLGHKQFTGFSGWTYLFGKPSTSSSFQIATCLYFLHHGSQARQPRGVGAPAEIETHFYVRACIYIYIRIIRAAEAKVVLNMKNNFLKGIKKMRGGALLPVEEGLGAKS